MPELPIVGDKPAEAAGGVKGTLTRKVGPLPLWAYAVIAGGLVLALRIYTGNAGRKGTVSQVSAAVAPAAGGGSQPGNLIRPEPPRPPAVAPVTPVSPAPVSTPTGPTVSAAPIVQPNRIDTSTGGLRKDAAGNVTGTEENFITPIGIVLSKVTGSRASELNVQSGSIIQYVNGIPISLSNAAVAAGGIPATSIPPVTK